MVSIRLRRELNEANDDSDRLPRSEQTTSYRGGFDISMEIVRGSDKTTEKECQRIRLR